MIHMPAQSQSRPSTTDELEELVQNLQSDEKRTQTSNAANSWDRRFFRLILVIVLCVICFRAGIALRHERSFHLNHDVRDGYLSPMDYVLVDSSTKEPGQQLFTLNLRSMSSVDDPSLMTTKGIQNGSSWQDIVDAYGEITVSSITYNPDCYDLSTINYANDVTVSEPMTIAEFDRNYVQTGLCNPDTDRIYMRFELFHDGYHLYYSRQELDSKSPSSDDLPWYLRLAGPLPKDHKYELSISLLPGKGVNYISTYYE